MGCNESKSVDIVQPSFALLWQQICLREISSSCHIHESRRIFAPSLSLPMPEWCPANIYSTLDFTL